MKIQMVYTAYHFSNGTNAKRNQRRIEKRAKHIQFLDWEIWLADQLEVETNKKLGKPGLHSADHGKRD